jgi:hypothetical protein
MLSFGHKTGKPLPTGNTKTFGRKTGNSLPTSHTEIFGARSRAGKLLANQAGTRRQRDETFVSDGEFDESDELVGGKTFRADKQHEGLPTALAEAYADGAADNYDKQSLFKRLKSSAAPWDTFTTKAYEAGFELGDSYSPLTRADAVRSLTTRTVLASPAVNSSGDALAVAGFHPSAISASVSESVYGHHKIFEAQAAVLESRRLGKLSNEATDVAIAAIHLASLAPGDHVPYAAFNRTKNSKMSGNVLLPDKPETYETRREGLKMAVASRVEALAAADAAKVERLVDAYLKSVAHTTLPAGVETRKLAPVINGSNKRSTSPLRTKPTAATGTLQKGSYEKTATGDLMVPAPVTETIADAARLFFDP